MIQPIERPLQPLVVAAGQIQAPRYQFASARRLDGLRSGVRAPDGLMQWRKTSLLMARCSANAPPAVGPC